MRTPARFGIPGPRPTHLKGAVLHAPLALDALVSEFGPCTRLPREFSTARPREALGSRDRENIVEGRSRLSIWSGGIDVGAASVKVGPIRSVPNGRSWGRHRTRGFYPTRPSPDFDGFAAFGGPSTPVDVGEMGLFRDDTWPTQRGRSGEKNIVLPARRLARDIAWRLVPTTR